MGIVQRLDERTIARIAAGEVVEKPAAVVKELIENSIDAGARSILVEIERGGTSLMRVSDDGAGMTREDALLALERHATSKIRSGDDLTAITSMGFRGEALASIGAVSRLSIETVARGEQVGTRVGMSGGEPLDTADFGGRQGTTVTVSDLFFNTPARRKFLRSIAAESSSIVGVVGDAMLAWPEVAFRLSLGGSVRLVSSGDGDRRPVAAQVLGGALGDGLVDLPLEPLPGLPYAAGGLFSPPGTSLATRRGIKVFVNRRPVRHLGLARACSAAYANALPVGTFPVALLFIESPLDCVDINVHPAKIEVKLQRGSMLEGGVVRWLSRAVAGQAGAREWTLPAAAASGGAWPGAGAAPALAGGAGAGLAATAGAPGGVSDLDAFLGPANAPSPQACSVAALAPAGPGEPRAWSLAGPPDAATPGHGFQAEGPGLATASAGAVRAGGPEGSVAGAGTAAVRSAAALGAPETPSPAPSGQMLPGRIPGIDLTALEVVGQVLVTYIVATDGQSIFLFDQHVVHERILFERALERLNRPSVDQQRLLFPVTIPFPEADEGEMREVLPVLARHGFEAEVFDGPTLVLTALPSIDARLDAPAIAASLVAQAVGLARTGPEEALRRLAAVIACRSAVKAGDPLTAPDAASLLRQLALAQQPATCPHGRPAVLRIGREELGRHFLRC